MSQYIRETCKTDGCTRLQRNKGVVSGKRVFGKFCGVCHKKTGSLSATGYHITNRMANSKCEVCGYDKAPCDRHRINPELGYVDDNVKILCPNCHREVTLGLLTI